MYVYIKESVNPLKTKLPKISAKKIVMCMIISVLEWKRHSKVLIHFEFNLILIKFLLPKKNVWKPKEFTRILTVGIKWVSNLEYVCAFECGCYSTLLFHVVHLFMFRTCFSSIFMALRFPVPQISSTHTFAHSFFHFFLGFSRCVCTQCTTLIW